MTQYATWGGYGGDARIWLALGLLAAAVAAVLLDHLLPAGHAQHPSVWAERAHAKLTILPVTLTAAAVLFIFIIARRSPDVPTRMAGAIIGAIAAPMIFELPFDPIVIFRFHMVVPGPPPWALVYPPPLLTEITTLLLLLWLRLSPTVRVTRATFFSFARMLGVWAAWALAGFGYPSAPLPIALNIASKLLAFVAAFTLFLPRRPATGRRDAASSRPAGLRSPYA